MSKTIIKTLVQAAVIVVAGVAIAAATNAIRSDGIPLVTDIPYEIMVPCPDSEADSQAANVSDLVNNDKVLFVDARPKEIFEAEHVEGAINVPYSALFGAAKEDIEKVAAEAKAKGATKVVVYGEYEDPEVPGEMVDFGRPLANQLLEEEVLGVEYVEGGLKTLNTKGVKTVKRQGGLDE